MTTSQFEALKMTVPGATPFAGAVIPDPTADEPGLIVPGATTGAFSMPDGFNATFDAAPTASGASMVQRGQINYIGKMASYAPFMGQAGCSYWGFDPAVCVALGGYPKDAILTLVKDGCYLKIISLIDNNLVDFTGTTDTTQAAYSTIVNGTVDGVNWQYLSLDPQTLIDQSIIAEIPKTEFTYDLSQPLNVFKAANEAALVVNGGLVAEVDKPVETEGKVENYVWSVRIVVSSPRDSLSDLANWVPGAVNTGTGSDTTIYRTGGEKDSQEAQINVKTVITVPGKYYGIGLVGKAWAPTSLVGDNWTLRVNITEATVKVQMKLI